MMKKRIVKDIQENNIKFYENKDKKGLAIIVKLREKLN